jgi:hypothetical protein
MHLFFTPESYTYKLGSLLGRSNQYYMIPIRFVRWVANWFGMCDAKLVGSLQLHLSFGTGTGNRQPMELMDQERIGLAL